MKSAILQMSLQQSHTLSSVFLYGEHSQLEKLRSRVVTMYPAIQYQEKQGRDLIKSIRQPFVQIPTKPLVV